MWVISKDYSVNDLSVKKAGKDGYLDALSSLIAPDALYAQIAAARSGKGEVFSITRKRQLVGVIILSREIMDASQLIEAHSKLSDLTDDQKPASVGTKPLEGTAQAEVLRLTARYVLPEHDEAIRAIEASSDIAAELSNLMLDEKTKAIFYGESIIIPRKVHIGKYTVSGFTLGIALGILFGIAMKNIGVGLCFGVCFAASFGTLFGRIDNKS